MIRACLPESLKYYPIAQPEYGAKNWRGAASDAVAATMIEYWRASWFFKTVTMFLTVDLFCPIATYMQYNESLGFPLRNAVF